MAELFRSSSMMKRLSLLITFSIILSSSVWAKPFKRALVLAGGGLAPISYASIAKHLEYYGWKPDVIITTCGSSLSSSALMAYPDREQLYNFFLSKDFHSFMRTPELKLRSAFEIQKFLNPVTEQLNMTMFTDYIMDIPNQVEMRGAKTHFPQSGTRYIMIAGKALFSPGENFEALRYRYKETYFTDSSTAAILRGRRSAVAKQFPKSYIDPYVEVRTDFEPLEAARASISDPLLINPAEFDGEHFLTGGINLYPIELAKDIADEIMVTYPLKFPDYMSEIVEKTYGYSALKRQEWVSQQTGFNWIDVYGKNNGFSPELVFLKVYEGVPKNFFMYRKIAKMEWEFGQERAAQALNAKANNNRLGNIHKLFPKQKSKKVEENFKKRLKKPHLPWKKHR